MRCVGHWRLWRRISALAARASKIFSARTFEQKENWLLQLKSFTAMTGYQNRTPYVSEMTNLV